MGSARRIGARCALIILLVAACDRGNCNTNANAEDQGYRFLETQILDRTQVGILQDIGETWDFWEWPREGATALIFSSASEASDVEEALQSAGIQFSEKTFRPPRPLLEHEQSGFFRRFLRLKEIYSYLDKLANDFADIVTVLNIGSTVMDQDIKVIRITNALKSGEKKIIFIDAGIHGREWIAPHEALYTIVQLVENYTANRELLNGLEWYILPVFNPDGYEYSFNTDRFWRKTWSFNGDSDCFGVDMDRNFPFHWGESGVIEDPCSPVFGGHEAFSETETRAFADFVRDLVPELQLYLSLRSYGPSLLFPWDYTFDEPKDANELKQIAESAASALEAVRGTKYAVGSAANVNHKSSGTVADWMKEMVGVKYVYTLFLPPGGSGFDPSPDEILPVVEETFEAIKVLSLAAKKAENNEG